MSDYGLTLKGFNPKPASVILEEINQKTRDIFGEINLSPSSPDGQYNAVMSNSIADLWLQCDYTYTSFDPQGSSGVPLSRIVGLNGIKLKAATKSTAVCTFFGNSGTNIPAGFQVSVSASNAIFETTTSNVIDMTGEVAINMRSLEFGPIQADPNTLVNFVNPPPNGLVSVTNANAAILGANEENNIQLRARQVKSTGLPGQYLLDSLRAQLLAIENVKSVKVYENDTPTFDPVTQLPPHSIKAVVFGGADNDIGVSAYLNKSPGAQPVGDVTVIVPMPEGGVYTSKFSRPTLIPIYVTINTVQTSGFPGDGIDQIKAAILAYAELNFNISDNILRTRLFTPINSIPGHSVQQLFIGTAPTPTGTDDIEIGLYELGQFLNANIVVNVT